MPVAVIGRTSKGLGANLDAVGKTISVDGHEFFVIGTMLRPAASMFGDTDNRVMIPYGMMQKMYPSARENALVVTAKAGMLPQALDEVRTVLRVGRRVPFGKADDFALSTAGRWSRFPTDHRRHVPVMRFSVPSAPRRRIGVMNIMLVW